MKLFFTLLSIIVSVIINAQSITNEELDNKAHRRYWYYRTRMVNDFMKIGKEQGDCIMFPQRNNFKNETK